MGRVTLWAAVWALGSTLAGDPVLAQEEPGEAASTEAEASDDATDAETAAAGTAEGAAGDTGTPAAQDAAGTQALDRVHLKDGSVILGRITGLEDGELRIETAFGVDEVVQVRWSEVESLTTGLHEFVLTNGMRIKGRIVRSEDGKAEVEGQDVEGQFTLGLEQIERIDPSPVRAVKVSGNLNFGGAIADGNTQTRAANLNGEFIARSERQRLTLRGAWNYAEDSGGLTARNTRGSGKYDFFFTERLFAFTSAFFEEDTFQDLNLRTALAAGPGYQFVNPGDFENSWLDELELFGEAGVAYFNEDFETSADNSYVSLRWAVDATLPVNDRVTFFHNHEGFPGLEDLSDLYITTEQGIRLTIIENFNATFQVNWHWDNTPSTGFERSDTQYLWTLGYTFKI